MNLLTFHLCVRHMKMKKSLLEKNAQLTDDDQTCGLEKLLIVPRGMLHFQDVTDSIVLPQPQGGVHSQTREKSEHFLTNSDLMLRWNTWGVAHLHHRIEYSGRVHFAINDLQLKEIKARVNNKKKNKLL